jgi:hypothetical protein
MNSLKRHSVSQHLGRAVGTVDFMDLLHGEVPIEVWKKVAWHTHCSSN